MVRDLAWACFSSPLLDLSLLDDTPPGVSDCGLQLTTERRRWLQALDDSPGTLTEFLSERHSRRLGLYFEALWHFFLAQDPHTELLAHNLPVHEQGKTLGEFDVLYFCRDRQRHCHLELAVKFYLGTARDTSPVAGEVQWLGPNREDRLDRKLSHLFSRQTQLADQAAARPVLEGLGVQQPLKEIALRGYLFQSSRVPTPLPAACRQSPIVRGNQPPIEQPSGNQSAANHHWIELAWLESYSRRLRAEKFLVLPRLRWLTPAVCAPGDSLFSAAEFTAHAMDRFADRPVPFLVSGLGGDGTEEARFFVTPDGWPADQQPGAAGG